MRAAAVRFECVLDLEVNGFAPFARDCVVAGDARVREPGLLCDLGGLGCVCVSG
jgi:hypothetical protein